MVKYQRLFNENPLGQGGYTVELNERMVELSEHCDTLRPKFNEDYQET